MVFWGWWGLWTPGVDTVQSKADSGTGAFSSATIPYSPNSENNPYTLVLGTKHTPRNSQSEPPHPPSGMWARSLLFWLWMWEMAVAGVFGCSPTNIWSCSSDHLVELCFFTQLNLGMTIGIGLAKKEWVKVASDTLEDTLCQTLFSPSCGNQRWSRQVLFHHPEFQNDANAEQNPQPTHEEHSRSKKMFVYAGKILGGLWPQQNLGYHNECVRWVDF